VVAGLRAGCDARRDRPRGRIENRKHQAVAAARAPADGGSARGHEHAEGPMTLTFCPRETEALTLVGIGQWPARAEPELLRHVAGCASCAEAIEVATALAEIEESDERPPLPDAAVVWQRAQWQA